MGRKSTVDKLPDDQFDFVIRGIIEEGWTDREISAKFEAEFKKPLPKSSLNYWRNAGGNEMADRYRMARYQARKLREDLNLNEADDYENVIKNIEERLLTATRELIHKDPVKLLGLRQEDERLKIKREVIGLNRQKLEFDKQRHEKELAVRTDVLAIGAKAWQFVLYFMNENEPHVADAMTRRSGDILTGLEGYLLDEAA
jgi:hypothetical protein